MAVLVRASFQMREIEDRFIMLGLPYRVVGGPRFYERAEIRDANAYLRLVFSDADDLAFERVVNKPKRGLGTATVQKIVAAARAARMPLLAASRALVASDELPTRARNGLGQFVGLIDRWSTLAKELPHTELAEIVLDESGYTAMWQNDRSPDAPGKLDNLKELIRSMEQFDSLAEYLEHISLVMELEEADTADKVTLMTLHSAKGLEFETVFLPGWEEGLFPHQRALDQQGLAGLEEERRLAYVGITRAKREAIVSFAANRRVHGLWQSALPSRFIAEIPEDHAEVEVETGLAGGSAFVPETAHEGSYPGPGWRRMVNQMRAQETERGFVQPQIIEETAELVATSDPGAASYSVGERIFHQKFGYGRITDVDGNKLTVDFEKAGVKRVIDSFVERHGT
jgi:DNA helicase-2/ATP-dependent DNA helicase PcrA